MAEEKDERLLQTDTRVETLSGTGTVDFRVPGLTILWHPDPSRVGEFAPLPGLTAGQPADLSRREPAFSAPRVGELRPLSDPYLSRRPVQIVSEPTGICVRCSDTVTRVYANGFPIPAEQSFSVEELEDGIVLLLSNRVVLLLHCIQPFLSHKVPYYGMVGDSAGIVRVRRDIEQVADLPVPVLIRGETGTGKELVAEAIHRAGPRQDGPFVALNMGAIPPTLAAAELFGAARGAFTGADQKRVGYFRQAEGGTLFLDEIGETPPEIQVMLLRVLETRTIQPVGATRGEKVDVRLTSATDADLQEATRAQRFREPLLHRLSGYEVRLPPLRRRREDIGRLLCHFLREELERLGDAHLLRSTPDDRSWVPAELVARLARFDWPGNIRQLRNVVRQMVIASRGASSLKPGPQVKELLASVPHYKSGVPARQRTGSDTMVPSESTAGSEGELSAELGSETVPDQGGPEADPPERANYRSPAGIGEEELVEALRAHRWRLQATAAALSISRTSLYDLIARSSRIKKAGDLTREEIEEARRRCDGNLEAMVDLLEVSERGLTRRMNQLSLR